jgi:hypothetical protein
MLVGRAPEQQQIAALLAGAGADLDRRIFSANNSAVPALEVVGQRLPDLPSNPTETQTGSLFIATVSSAREPMPSFW